MKRKQLIAIANDHSIPICVFENITFKFSIVLGDVLYVHNHSYQTHELTHELIQVTSLVIVNVRELGFR